MLNLSFFRNPRFSMASAGISIAFFSLFGAIFALTQFLQDAYGYSALEAGAAMTPIAAGLVLGAVSSIKLAARFGTGRIVAFGLFNIGGLLAFSLTWTADMPYWPLGVWFFGLATCMGMVTGPATDSVMGAVPEEKSGVASAMNDVTRQVAGALGTAVIGSLITSLYGVEDRRLGRGAAGGGARRGRGLDRPGERRRGGAAGGRGREPDDRGGERVHRGARDRLHGRRRGRGGRSGRREDLAAGATSLAGPGDGHRAAARAARAGRVGDTQRAVVGEGPPPPLAPCPPHRNLGCCGIT